MGKHRLEDKQNVKSQVKNKPAAISEGRASRLRIAGYVLALIKQE